MSTRARRPGRRTWVYLGLQTSCVIWGQQRSFGRWGQWDVVHRAFAYEMTCLLKLPSERDLQRSLPWQDEIPREIRLGQRMADFVAGDVVYALYSRPSHAVKIGRTTNVLHRWAKLENESGQLRQLLCVWRCPSSRDMERELHERWSQHRTVGEWFAADPVLAGLRQLATGTEAVAA